VTAESWHAYQLIWWVFTLQCPKNLGENPVSNPSNSEKLKDSHPLKYGQTSIVSFVADFARIGSKKSVSYIHCPFEIPLCGQEGRP
jgi:hypothetical protein